ncbi:MAG: TIM44-like domain-containing protein [Planctomycetota bacterium]|nr:TIM44-like domain-containing protein [Planctomycetota bacterium]
MKRILLGLALALGVLPAGQALARGGGGCLEEGTPVLTPRGAVAIEQLAPGDVVLAPAGDIMRQAVVQACIRVQPEAYLELEFDGGRVRVTPEHPLAAAAQAGVYRMASALAPGDGLWRWDGARLGLAGLRAARRVAAERPAYNLLVSPGGTFVAGGLLVHNKGCFLPDTPILRADGSEAAIRDVRPGDRLMAYTPNGAVTTAVVREVLTAEVPEYVVVSTPSRSLSVTAEHPFYVGDGTFKTLEALAVGDRIRVLDGRGLREEPIESIRRILGPTLVYNLRTDEPHTYFASGVAVHNKGGGCFPAGTPVETPQGETAIEKLAPGDCVLAVDRLGRTRTVTVRGTYAARSRILVVETERGTLRTTPEQPLAMADGTFRTAGDLAEGAPAALWAWTDGRAAPATVRLCRLTDEEVPVFNLQVDGPHTFIAGGVVVHNKGGGGGGHGGGGGFHGSGGYYSGGRRGMADFVIWGVIVGTVIVFLIAKAVLEARNKEDEDLDYSYSPADFTPKTEKTQRLLEFIAKEDPAFKPDQLQRVAQATFCKLQQCWQSREYDPMKPLLMPDLYNAHLMQLAGMRRDHEVNIIEGLIVDRIDIVNVRYTNEPDHREFTALISAEATDYYLDDRTRVRLRGDESPAKFQEFWTFQLQGGSWLLREIEQTRESDALKHENFFAPMTDAALKQIYAGDEAQGPAGPWLEKGVAAKETRTERLLNFLVQTDPLWDRQAMLERARQIFIRIYAARETGDPAQTPAADLFPDVAADLAVEMRQRQASGVTIAFRNLCIRKAELLLVRNFADNSKDEFTVRMSAHAQKTLSRGGVIVVQDPYVAPFEDYWTFGRMDGQWKLKEILPAAKGQRTAAQENLDEDSSAGQLEWYYQHKRAN